MKTIKFLKTATVVAALSMGSLIASAADTPGTPPPPAGGGRPGGPGPGGPGGPGAAPMQRGGFVNFDEKQREVLREAMQKDQEQVRALEEKLRSAQKEMMQAILAEKYDEKVVREKAESVAKIQTDITLLRAKSFSALAPTLKSEQREQLENSPFGPAMLSGRFGGGFGGRDTGPGGGGPTGRRRGGQ